MFKINEFFTSIQGEGIYAGELHLFIRLSGCNINCSFCDTDTKLFKEISIEELISNIHDEYMKERFKKISFTGGEPLLYSKDILKLLKRLSRKYNILIESNSTLPEKIKELSSFVDVVSMDFKLEYHDDNFELFKDFYNNSHKAERYIKIVYKSSDREKIIRSIDRLKDIISKDTVIFLQPITPFKKEDIELGEELLKKYYDIRLKLLPQLHTILGIR